jgi:hypothetical protein
MTDDPLIPQRIRRRRVDQCLFAVVMEAYLHGTSTRKVDDMVKALVADLGGRDVGLRSLAEQIDTPVPQDVGASCVRRVG